MEKTFLTHKHVNALAMRLAADILAVYGTDAVTKKMYPIPRGGVPVAYILQGHIGGGIVTDDPAEADFFVDDLLDSGATMERWCDAYPGKPFFVLIDKKIVGDKRWYVFPWEVTDKGADQSLDDNVVRLLQFIGEDPKRGGLLETPKRVSKAWKDWTSGYTKDPKEILKVFEDGGEKYDQMVVVKDIPFYSLCEHHMAPFFGTATVAYIPNGRIVGLSKISRLVDMYARRLQVQERLTTQVAAALWENLDPHGVGVVIRARHLCMESRGICQQGHHTETTELLGLLRSDVSARSEFLLAAK